MKPMLACSTIPSLDEIQFPVLASSKLDGIRCIMKTGAALSRTMKRIPNNFICDTLAELKLHGLDGELMVDGEFEKVSSAVMSHHGRPDFYYNVFDYYDSECAFTVRSEVARQIVSELHTDRVRFVEQRIVTNQMDLNVFYEDCLAKGYEGLIVRDPTAPYKHGRSTMKQGWMLKLKPFDDSEATIVGFEELMHNDDTSTRKIENQIPGNVMGALIVMGSKGNKFKIGSGFDIAQRDEMWRNIDYYLGKTVVYKHQGLTKYGKPRFPIYKGLRHVEDIS